ncbi:MAG: hypothetical protein K6B39_10835 [Lachnospiraceae bacterium]|nr:hypothetical protein [Lachnospiraceae bacterium]MCR5087869.1 hypothetical protein [Lachnospiraceae bacterium]
MKKEKPGSAKKKIILVAGAIALIVLIALAWVLYWDFSNGHVVVRLGRYRGLTVDAGGRDAGQAVLDAVMSRTKFGRAAKREADAAYESAMKAFLSEAEYLHMDFADYLAQNYHMTEEEFRAKVRETSDADVRQSAVLRAIAQREKITFSDDEMEKVMPYLLEAYGYTDEKEFAKNEDLELIRDAMLLEKVRAFLVEKNTVVNAASQEQE